VNTEILLPDNTFQVEMEALSEIDSLLFTTHLARFENFAKVHLDLSFIMPGQRKSGEDVWIAQQTPKSEKDRNYNAMHAKFNKRIETFVKQVLNNSTVKVTYRIRELGGWEEPSEQATQAEEATQSRRVQPSREAAVLSQEERRRSGGGGKKK
jgi:hypothetical protein